MLTKFGAVAGACAIVSIAPVLASPISDKYAALGGAAGFLGAPETEELTAPDGVGKYRHYKGGSIYWSPRTGAYEVHGLIRQRWAQLGWEKSYLGYPMTDEIDTYDGLGKVSKFQGGALIWRKSTNAVSEVKSTDLLVDLPTPVGESWLVIQANYQKSGDSHSGKFVYCYDLISAEGQPKTKGKKFVSTADAKIVLVEENFDGPAKSNVIVQKLGTGRYASTLHFIKGSYSKHYGADKFIVGAFGPWDGPTPKSGEVLAETGDVGAKAGAYHIHYCITTAPDHPNYAPFESVPFAFRNYESSTDNKTWKTVAAGVPRRDEYIRRKAGGGGPAAINAAAELLNYGSVEGSLALPAGVRPTAGSLVVTAVAPWGEPMTTTKIPIAMIGRQPASYSYKLAKVPNYPNVKIRVHHEGGVTNPAGWMIDGESAAFNVKADTKNTVNVGLKAAQAPVIK